MVVVMHPPFEGDPIGVCTGFYNGTLPAGDMTRVSRLTGWKAPDDVFNRENGARLITGVAAEIAPDQHTSFFGIGAYAAAIACTRLGTPFLLDVLLGALLLQTGNHREAFRVVGEALRLAPGDAGAHLLMAFLQAAAGNPAAARAEAERVLQLNPQEPQARRLLESLPR